MAPHCIEPGPVLTIWFGGQVIVHGMGVTITHRENSEVLLFGSVAVAVMNWFGATAVGKVTIKLASPMLSVVTIVEPRNV